MTDRRPLTGPRTDPHSGRCWPWTPNPYDGKRYVVSWFMFRIAERFPGREIRLPFGTSTWKVTETPDVE